MFFVSTLDRIPPPFWTVGISEQGTVYFLDSSNLEDWNKMFKNERLKISTDAQLTDFAKTFLNLAVGKAIYLTQLTPGEAARIEKKMGKISSPSLRIIRTSGRYRLQFYAKNVGGALQLWDLIAEPTGQILKADVREF